MDVQVGLVIFAANQNKPMAPYVLLQTLQEKSNCLGILACALQDDLDSVSLTQMMIERCCGVTGHWIELSPKQVGVFDDVKRNPSYRQIMIVYSLFIPEPMKVFDQYEWVRLDSLKSRDLYLDTEAIIRYAALGENKYAT